MDKSVTISIISGVFSLLTAMFSLWFKDRLEQRRMRPSASPEVAAPVSVAFQRAPVPAAMPAEFSPPNPIPRPAAPTSTFDAPDPGSLRDRRPAPGGSEPRWSYDVSPRPAVRDEPPRDTRAPPTASAAAPAVPDDSKKMGHTFVQRIVAGGGVAPLLIIGATLLLVWLVLRGTSRSVENPGIAAILGLYALILLIVPTTLLVMVRRRSRSLIVFSLQMATYWSGFLAIVILPIIASGSPLGGGGVTSVAWFLLGAFTVWLIIGMAVLRPWRRRSRSAPA